MANRKVPGKSGGSYRYLDGWIDKPPPPPKVELPMKKRERISMKVKNVWFRQTITALHGHPSYLGSGTGWERFLITAREDYIRVEQSDLARPDAPAKVICIPFDNVAAFELFDLEKA